MTRLLVEDTSLVAVADSIRTKGETTAQLTFPDGFVDAIGNIESGTNYAIAIFEGATNITADMLAGCTKLRDYAFAYWPNLESAVIPEGVRELGTYLFQNCSKLTRVTLPEGIYQITEGMFDACKSLASITIPESVKYISSYSFMNTSLSSITIPKKVTSINVLVFYNCSKLTTVVMKPTTPPTLKDTAFSQCPALSTIIVPAGTLDAYQSASNWSTYANLMVEATE